MFLNEDSYLNFVIDESIKKDKYFLLDSGEGNGVIDAITGWHIEDLSGWLINEGDKDDLLKARERGTAYVDFSDSYVFAKWSKSDNGILKIDFVKY